MLFLAPLTVLALLPFTLSAPAPAPSTIASRSTVPLCSEYSYTDVQIALRKPDGSSPGGDMCLHPGGPSPDPETPSIGLYGGLKVGLTACSEAGYRWSVRADGKGIVVGNGQDAIWGLNAEEVEVDSEVTIREADPTSPNQEFRLVQERGQIRLGYTEGPLLCLAGSEEDGSVKVAVCGTDDVREQSWVILMLPQPAPGTSAAVNCQA